MNKNSIICANRTVSMCQVVSNRLCQICSSSSSCQWHTGQNYLDKLGSQTCEHNIDPSAWVCDDCFTLRAHVVRQGKYQSIRDEVLEYSLKMLKDKVVCLVRDAMNLFKGKILQHTCAVTDSEWNSYRKTLGTQLESRGYKSYFMARKLGSMYYDPSVFSGKGVELLYKILNENKPVSPTHAESIRTLIKQQVALYYRQVFGDESGSTFKLNKYMNDELMGFVDDITKSDRRLSSTSKKNK